MEIKSPESEKELNVAILTENENIEDPTNLITSSCPISIDRFNSTINLSLGKV